jgi:hypothetical protein
MRAPSIFFSNPKTVTSPLPPAPRKWLPVSFLCTLLSVSYAPRNITGWRVHTDTKRDERVNKRQLLFPCVFVCSEGCAWLQGCLSAAGQGGVCVICMGGGKPGRHVLAILHYRTAYCLLNSPFSHMHTLPRLTAHLKLSHATLHAPLALALARSSITCCWAMSSLSLHPLYD